ncbi:hypothetical protein DH2020_000176 [Rehmannia glutinosa]|uniref:RING-CH-type domain-containing protein n=1 Tax=Rehmannia glutinosa TaxID=99300 RepID=A0ABR0XVS0_REHGL
MSTEEKNRSINPQLHDEKSDCERQAVVPIAKISVSRLSADKTAVFQQLEKSLGMTEETSQSKQCRKPNLFLEIPTRPLELPPQEFVQIDMPLTPTPTPKKVNFLLSPGPSDSRLNVSSGPSSTRGKSSIRSFLPKLSFKNRGSNSDADKAATIDSVFSTVVTQDKLPISRSWSFSKIFTPRVNRTSSLPVPPLANSNPDSNHGGSINSHLNTKEVRKISRSRSVPVINKEKGIQRMNSFFRVIPSTPRAKEDDSEVSMATKGDDENNESNGEDIPEEEAVCRICFVELCEGGETLKMECSCKGELALAHQECAVKWFAIKGFGRNCLFLSLSVRKMDTSAIAISVPFSCALGLLSSVTSSTMVKRKFVWVYASIQFTLVVLFAHIFYNLVHVQAVVSILLSTFAGFGVAMSGASILVEVLRWRERHSVVINQNAISNAPPPSLIATPVL